MRALALQFRDFATLDRSGSRRWHRQGFAGAVAAVVVCCHAAVPRTTVPPSEVGSETPTSRNQDDGFPFVDCLGTTCIDTQTVLPFETCALATYRDRDGAETRYLLHSISKPNGEASLLASVRTSDGATFEQQLARSYVFERVHLLQTIPAWSALRSNVGHYIPIGLSREFQHPHATLWLRAASDLPWTPTHLPLEVNEACTVTENSAGAVSADWSLHGSFRAPGTLVLTCPATPPKQARASGHDSALDRFAARGTLIANTGSAHHHGVYSVEWQRAAERWDVRNRVQAPYEATVITTATLNGRMFAFTSVQNIKISSALHQPNTNEIGVMRSTFTSHASTQLRRPDNDDMIVTGCWARSFDPSSVCVYQYSNVGFSVLVASPQSEMVCVYEVYQNTAPGARLLEASCWQEHGREPESSYRVDIVVCEEHRAAFIE